VRTAVRRDTAGERLNSSWRGRFLLLPRFDARWAIVDRDFKYDVVVFCHARDDAEIILAVLNREVPSGVRRMSRSCISVRSVTTEMF
jgi:hypothetical protein